MPCPRPLDKQPSRLMRAMLSVMFIACLSSCATNPAPDAAGPRADEQSAQILLTEDSARLDAALAAWASLTRAQGITNAPAPEFQPVTLTIRRLPQMPEPLYLPKVGEGVPMTEEETREALRRFIAETGPLLCTDRQRLSLVQRIDGADGVKEALYEQRPFRYPVRGGYGDVRISFAPDRRVLQIHSTCIPDVENIRRSFAGIGPRLTPEKAAETVVGRTATYTDASGNSQTLTVMADDKINVREQAIYPVERAGQPATLEIHLVWEITVERVLGLVIYLDIVTGEITGAELRPRP